MQKSNAGFHERYAEIFRQASTRVRAMSWMLSIYPEGVLGVVMVGQLYQIGRRALPDGALPGWCWLLCSTRDGIRIYHLQVVLRRSSRHGAFPGAGGVVVDVRPSQLSGEGWQGRRWNGGPDGSRNSRHWTALWPGTACRPGRCV